MDGHFGISGISGGLEVHDDRLIAAGGGEGAIGPAQRQRIHVTGEAVVIVDDEVEVVDVADHHNDRTVGRVGHPQFAILRPRRLNHDVFGDRVGGHGVVDQQVVLATVCLRRIAFIKADLDTPATGRIACRITVVGVRRDFQRINAVATGDIQELHSTDQNRSAAIDRHRHFVGRGTRCDTAIDISSDHFEHVRLTRRIVVVVANEIHDAGGCRATHIEEHAFDGMALHHER